MNHNLMNTTIHYLAAAALSVLLALSLPSCRTRGNSAADGSADARTEYHNSRFGFTVSLPGFLAPSAPPENGDGLEFSCGDISIVTYGAMMLQPTLEEFLEAEKSFFLERGDVLDTVEAVRDGFVLRGRIPSEGLLLYEKSVLAESVDGEQITCTAYLTYPESESARAQQVISALESFPGGLNGAR